MILADFSEAELSRLKDMARIHFGYGAWTAPIWFVGPEEGFGSPNEMRERLLAWNGEALDNCLEFHERMPCHRWHRDKEIQKTWARLIRLLLVYRGLKHDTEDIRHYQTHHWGQEESECVIELSGLPAPNLQTGRQLLAKIGICEADWKQILDDRIQFLKTKMEQSRTLRVIVLYGLNANAKKYWEKFLGRPIKELEILRCKGILITLAAGPTSPKGSPYAYWDALAMRLRAANERSSLTDG